MSVEFLGGTHTGAGGQPLPFSPAVKAGPFVFVSGQIAMGANGEIVPGGIEAQTRQTLKNVEKALALAGCARHGSGIARPHRGGERRSGPDRALGRHDAVRLGRQGLFWLGAEPVSVPVRYELARALAAHGMHQEALGELDQALAIQPTNTSIQRLRAEISALVQK